MSNMIAERYLLGELTEAERTAYEEHLFSCQACFEQIKAGTEFVTCLAQTGVEELISTTQPRWFQVALRALQPGPALAFALMFFGVTIFSGYQAIVIHKMNAPQVVSVFTIPPEARGEDRVVTASRQGSFELRVVFPPNPGLTAYTLQIVSESGEKKTAIPIAEPLTSELQARFAAAQFQNGKYTLLVQAVERNTGSRVIVDRYPFELRLKD
jgi:hypothetical protein